MGEHARILVIDDDQSIRTILKTILEEHGYIVDVAESGKQGIDKSHQSFYNLAIIDIKLQDMEGTKVLLMLKKTTPRMRKIIITGYPSLQNAIEALNKGADAYILKPFNMDTVLAIIKEHLKKQQEEMVFSQEKVTEFIKTHVKELEDEKQTLQNES
ncbi:response regulator [Candidatus Bathyarchaeota archaeon]|nr:response regulator [Candidatus Bathyarchaeota archaeon]